jgi:hypothetical protein
MSIDGKGPGQQNEEVLRSGEFSADRRFNPDSLFEVIASSESAHQAAEAMRVFIRHGDAAALEQAIAIYARSARARGQKIENLLAELNALSHQQHERYSHDGELLKPSQLKRLVLRTVLEAFES